MGGDGAFAGEDGCWLFGIVLVLGLGFEVAALVGGVVGFGGRVVAHLFVVLFIHLYITILARTSSTPTPIRITPLMPLIIARRYLIRQLQLLLPLLLPG